jgi:hypothetical protein
MGDRQTDGLVSRSTLRRSVGGYVVRGLDYGQLEVRYLDTHGLGMDDLTLFLKGDAFPLPRNFRRPVVLGQVLL